MISARTICKNAKKMVLKVDLFHCIPKIINASWKIDYRKISFSSKNKTKTMYIIRRGDSKVGLFSYFITALGGIAYADARGWIPVVDMKNYANTYLLTEEISKKNSWDYFFNQPNEYSLDEALASKNVIMGRKTPTYSFPRDNINFFHNVNGELDYWRSICKKYVTLNVKVIERLEHEKLIFNGKKVLGVSCRGTDYVAIKPKNHPIQPSVDMVIKKVIDAISNEGFDAVYLATEDSNIINEFKKYFKDTLLMLNREYVNYEYDKKDFVTIYSTNREDDKYYQGMDYLISMLLLRECNGLVTSMTSGTVGLMCLTEKFNYLHVFNLGYY